MRLHTAFGAATLAACALLPATPAARAADLGPMFAPSMEEAVPAQPMEFGTGWYLRGDASFGSEDRPKLDTFNNTPRFDANASASAYGFGLGAGYKFTSFFRADVTADYLEPLTYKANMPCGSLCNINLRTDVQRWDALVNGYADLGTWHGITPYVGAGVGVSGSYRDGSVSYNGGDLPTAFTDPSSGTLTNRGLHGRDDVQFAWAAMAGFSYALDPHLLLDVGYRYLDLGRTTIPLYPVTSVRKEITDQQGRVGVRYMID